MQGGCFGLSGKTCQALDRDKRIGYNENVKGVLGKCDFHTGKRKELDFMRKKYLANAAAFLTAVTMMTGVMPMTANAADGEVIVALGDSITTGYSNDGTLIASYADMVSSYYGADLINLAEDGATSADLLTKLSDASVQETIASADVILVSIGGNDIMQPLLSNDYIDSTQYQTMQGLIKAMREKESADPSFKLLFSLYLNNIMPDTITACRSNIEEIAAQLKSLNSSAEIVFQTVYNPMDVDADDTDLATSGTMETLSANVLRYVEGDESNMFYTYGVNDAIRGLEGVTIADSYETLFDHGHYYTNITYLDVHPNSIGHLAIAETVLSAMNRTENGTENGTLLRKAYAGSGAEQTLSGVNSAINESLLGRVLKNSYGDVDANGTVEIADATAALTIYACVGASVEPPITGVNAQTADGNKDGIVDLSDASLILSYYASVAARVFDGTFDEFVAQNQ